MLLPNFQASAEIGKPLWDTAVVVQNGAFLLQGCDAPRGVWKLSLCGNFAPADPCEQCSCCGFASDGSVRYTICISPGWRRGRGMCHLTRCMPEPLLSRGTVQVTVCIWETRWRRLLAYSDCFMAKGADTLSVWWILYSMKVKMMSVKSSVPEAMGCREPVCLWPYVWTAVPGGRGRLQSVWCTN